MNKATEYGANDAIPRLVLCLARKLKHSKPNLKLDLARAAARDPLN